MEEANYTVYKHTSPSEKVYIGITSKTAKERWGRNGIAYKPQTVLWNAICKYGWENIEHDIIASGLGESEAKDLEIALIAECRSMDGRFGYNRTIGGDGTQGWKHTEKQHAALMRNNKGNKYALGCIRSAETKAKISASRKDKAAVAQIGLDGKLIRIFKSVADAAKNVDGSRSNIAACCGGRQLTAYDYQWRYFGEEHSAEKVLKGGKFQPIQIVQLTISGEEVARYDSIKSAAKQFGCGLGRSGIARCLDGRAHKAYGYMWQYAG